MTRGPLSGAQQGRENAAALKAYLERVGDDLPMRGGKLFITAIAIACGLDRQVLHKNPACRELLAKAAERIQERPSTVLGGAEPEREVARLEAKVFRLEQRNAALKAENDELRQRLSRYRYIEEHTIETGRRVIP
jgi:hypothetical protein